MRSDLVCRFEITVRDSFFLFQITHDLMLRFIGPLIADDPAQRTLLAPDELAEEQQAGTQASLGAVGQQDADECDAECASAPCSTQ